MFKKCICSRFLIRKIVDLPFRLLPPFSVSLMLQKSEIIKQYWIQIVFFGRDICISGKGWLYGDSDRGIYTSWPLINIKSQILRGAGSVTFWYSRENVPPESTIVGITVERLIFENKLWFFLQPSLNPGLLQKVEL